jgi:hypothetical protein
MLEKFIEGRDVILFGGSPSYSIPPLLSPAIIRTNTHHIWQEDPRKVPEGFRYTDGVYFGANISGFIAMFMNRPPQKLKFLCQNAGAHYKRAMEAWAGRRGIAYKAYATEPAELLERGVDPAAYEAEYQPLIEVVKQPFTGVFAAYDLLRHNPKSLHLTGFDFYRETDTIKEGKRGEHSIDENLEAMRMICTDGRVKPDGILSDCLR